jgi:uncharacterized protein
VRQRVHLITLGVDELDRARAFYRALGWSPVADTPEGLVVFDLYGASLALYPRAELARDIGRDLPRGSGGLTLACNVRGKAEVAEVIAAARAAGAEILREPYDAPWGGHIAFFADPDGHVWEIAHNPFSALGAEDQFRWGGA